MGEVNGAVDSEREIDDEPTLDMIATILADPEWGVGMLEDIADLVMRTGRSMVNPAEISTWDRH
jgi:hypothetical protein